MRDLGSQQIRKLHELATMSMAKPSSDDSMQAWFLEYTWVVDLRLSVSQTHLRFRFLAES